MNRYVRGSAIAAITALVVGAGPLQAEDITENIAFQAISR